ncbi:MAG: hypothetical protein DRQ56_04325 [Gammaproteobacteria bacterium]|nr:MAG: hypothetical protein DRQ56_04325 [Gammaproteobacteria bacterium]
MVTTVDDLLKTALTELSLLPDQFYRLTPREFFYIAHGSALQYQKDLHRTRLFITALYNVNRNPKTRSEPFAVTDIMELPLLDKVDKKNEVERTKVGLKLMKEKWQV